MQDPHSLEQQLRYLEEHVVPKNEVVVVLDEPSGASNSKFENLRYFVDQIS